MFSIGQKSKCALLCRSKGPCEVFDPWVRWERVRLGSENSSNGGVWKSGNLEIWEFGDLGIWGFGTWKSRNLEIWGPGNPEIWDPTNGKIQIIKIKIRSAKNVGKVWISRNKILLAPFGATQAIFYMERKQKK